MRKATSLYLDLVRFGAALTVFAEHLRFHTKIGFQHFWNAHPFLYLHLNLYSQTAVTVFFVLSGYVIAHVLATRESTPLEYAASRFGRLYSVVLPALVLITVCNLLIKLKYPVAFEAFDSQGPAMVAFSYIGSALFMNRFWLWPNLDLPNAPLWTLSFEATYYVAIAVFVFAHGRARIMGLLGLALLTGPSMVLLAPTWAVGYAAYHMSRRWPLRQYPAVLLWLVSVILLPFCASLAIHYRMHLDFLRTTDQAIGALLAAYAAAICFTVNLLAFDAFADRVAPLFARFTQEIRWLGSLTFSLYLFHQPLLSLFTVYHMPDRSSLGQLVFMVGGTFLVVAKLGRFCEGTKGAYKRYFLAFWEAAAQRRAIPGWTPKPPQTLPHQVAGLRTPGEAGE